MGAGEFKSKCLKLMEQVNEYHTEIVITKRGKPVAKLVPMEGKKKSSLFGYLKNSVEIFDDITRPLDEKWEALG